MSIIEDVQQLRTLNIEIKTREKNLRKLRSQRKEIESRVLEYLEMSGEPGLKFRDMTVIAKQRNKRSYMKKTEKQNVGMSILEKHGIRNSKEALDELLNAMQGSRELESKLQVL